VVKDALIVHYCPLTVHFLIAVLNAFFFRMQATYRIHHTVRDFGTLIIYKKGKAVPLQAWSDPEGSMKLRFPDYMTTAQDGGKVVSLTHRPPLTPVNARGTHFC
jgi:hypothetical protein